MAWPAFHSGRAEPQGANQMAAPAVTRTPNMHRAKTNRSSRVRMEAWRQWPLGGTKSFVRCSQPRIDLTPTGLLMEGHFTFGPLVDERHRDVSPTPRSNLLGGPEDNFPLARDYFLFGIRASN